MATLQKMVAKMGTVQVSKKVVGESRTRGEGKIVERKEIKPGMSKSVVTAKATKSTSSKSSSTSTQKKSAGKTAKGDDLTKVEGIGPAIAKLLNAAKIYTFKELSDTKISQLQAILTKAGPRFQMHTPGSWPKQASLASDGRWDDLKKLQDVLTGGK
jgi:predicted flap endonuclease-1-like 5' DNA nuclease